MKYSCMLVVTLVAAINGFAVTVDGTLKWNGAASGGSWTDPANWVKTAGADDLSVSDLLGRSCRYDFTGLANGATLNNTTAGLKVGAIDFKTSNVGTVTLTGEEVFLTGAPEITVASGNTLVYKIGHKLWQTADGTGKIILLGYGTIRLEPTSTFWFYNRQIQPCNSTTLVIASDNCNLENTSLIQWNTSTIKLECNARVGHCATVEAGCSLDLGGHVMQICGSETAIDSDAGFRKYVGPIRGAVGSQIVWSGGEQYTVSGSVTAAGKFVVYDGRITLPATLPDDLTLSVQGNGKFVFNDSVTVGGIEGVVSAGGLELPEGKTLTVKNAQGGSFGGVISGASGLVVNSGSLTFDDRVSRTGLLGHWKFEDASALGADSGLRNRTLSVVKWGNKEQDAARTADGVFGGALNFPDTAGSDYHLKMDNISVGPGKLGTGTGPVSIDLWLRPKNTSGRQYVIVYGTWANYGQIGIWLDSGKKDLVVCGMNWEFSDTANTAVYNWPGLYDGKWHHVAVTYESRALKVYADGQNVKSKAMTGDLNIASGGFYIGNRDTSGMTYRYIGSIDEVRLWNRVLSADEIAKTVQGVMPENAELSAGVAALPAPVCHWAFDDAANPGKDSQGNATLVNNGDAPILENKAGNHGMSLKRGSSMMLPAADLPANFPLGNSPFTFSIRVMAAGGINENSKWVTWGPVDTPADSFWFWVGAGSPRIPNFNCGYQWVGAGRTMTSSGAEGSWRHYVITHNGVNEMRVYCDGALVPNDWWMTKAINVKKGDLVVGNSKQCQIDDIQIFNVALTAAEVGVLTRSLGRSASPDVLSATVSVQVDDGATLTASTGYFEAAALTGAGTVDLANGVQARVADASAFTGTLSGTGALATKSAVADATASCDVVVDGAWTIADGTKPGVQTSGRVFVPASGVLTVANPDATKAVDCVLAKGAQGVQATGGVDGWTSTLVADKWRTAFSISDDGTQFMCRTKPRLGLFLIVK